MSACLESDRRPIGDLGSPTGRLAEVPATDTKRAPGPPNAAGRSSLLDAVTPDVARSALTGTAFIAFPYPLSAGAETSTECPASRQFAVFRRPAAGGDEGTAKSQATFSHNLSLALCQGGPLGPDSYRALFAASDELLHAIAQAQPELAAQYGQRSTKIGGREARLAPLAIMGHGVTVTPVGVIEGRVAGFTLVASIEDATAHIGEPGRITMKEALDHLEAMLRAADAAIAR